MHTRAIAASQLADDLERPLLYTIWAGASLLLLLPLIISQDTLFPFIVGKALFARAMVEIIFALWVVLAYVRPSYRPRRSRILLVFGIYLGVALLAGLLGVSTQRSLWSTYERMQGVVDLAHWFLLAIVLASVFRDLNHWRVLLSINLGVSLVMALFGMAQHFGFSIPVYRFIQATPRLDITLGNPTYVGAYMMVNVLTGLGLLVESIAQSVVESSGRERPAAKASSPRDRRRRRRRARKARTETGIGPATWWRLFWAVAIGLDLLMLWWSGGRGAFVGLCVGLLAVASVYLAWGRLGAMKRAALWLVGALGVIALLLVVAKTTDSLDAVARSNIMVRSFSASGFYDNAMRGRFASLTAGLEGFAARPVLGWGPENYSIAWARYFDASKGTNETFDQAHNKLVEELTTKGALGLLSYLALWVVTARVIYRRARTSDPGKQTLILFIGAALIGYFVQNLFLFDTPATMLQFILFLGFAASMEAGTGDRDDEPADAGPKRSGPRGEEEADARPPWIPRLISMFGASVGRLAPLDGTRRPGHGEACTPKALAPNALLLMLFVAIALAGLGIYLSNYRPYNAALAIVQTTGSGITWEERFGYYEESIDSFPQLANYPRLILLGQLTDNWANVVGSNQVARALAIADAEGRNALRSEPEGWRMYVALARFYQAASTIDREHVKLARSYLRTARELAPEVPEVVFVTLRQRLIEISPRYW